MKPIYLDNHATTPIDPRVFEEIKPYFLNKFGNPSSIDHIYGNILLKDIKNARLNIATLINAEEEEIIFTSGATESNNLAIFGLAKNFKNKGNHIITTSIEHKSVLDTCKQLEKEGFKVTYLPINNNGILDLNVLKSNITKNTILISVMGANNEIGTIQPLYEIGKISKNNNLFFHVDAAQAYGNIDIDVKLMNIDLLSISGHKIYCQKGIGALFVKKQTMIKPLIYGGGHENGLRSGTLNVPGIIGLGKSAELCKIEKNNNEKIRLLTNKLFNGIFKKTKVELNGHPKNRLPNNLSLYFEGVDGKALINEVKDYIAISTGSACNANDIKPSHVLMSIFNDENRAYSTIRIGLNRFTTESDVNIAIEVITKAVNKLRNL
jgi:cysteine desulfurase